MNAPIICISREFGSGGRLIGEQLATALGIPFYDRLIIEKAAEESGLSPEFIEQEEQRFNNSMLFNLSMGSHAVTAAGVDLSSRVFEAERQAILEAAQAGSCVIVGRCADYILRHREDLFTVFISADIDWRVNRAVSVYGLAENKAEKAIRAKDKQRARHYNFYSDRNWGDRANYDIILNSSRLGIEGCVDLLLHAINTK